MVCSISFRSSGVKTEVIVIENTIFISIVYLVALALGACVWRKVVEYIDHWLQDHLEEYEYEVVMWVIFGIMLFTLITFGYLAFNDL